jgi:hypothetical protein
MAKIKIGRQIVTCATRQDANVIAGSQLLVWQSVSLEELPASHPLGGEVADAQIVALTYLEYPSRVG